MFETALLAAVFVFLGHAGFAPDEKPECTQTVTAPTLFKADDEPPTASAEYVFPNDTNSKPKLAVSLSFQSPLENETPDTYLISDFEVELQMPELPTGCEITALTMALNYYGCPADKVEIAERYLPTVPADLYYGDDGRLYGPDLNRYFVGDPATRGGYICGTEAIVYAANSHLADINSSLHAVDLTGSPAEDLYELVSERHIFIAQSALHIKMGNFIHLFCCKIIFPSFFYHLCCRIRRSSGSENNQLFRRTFLEKSFCIFQSVHKSGMKPSAENNGFVFRHCLCGNFFQLHGGAVQLFGNPFGILLGKARDALINY